MHKIDPCELCNSGPYCVVVKGGVKLCSTCFNGVHLNTTVENALIPECGCQIAQILEHDIINGLKYVILLLSSLKEEDPESFKSMVKFVDLGRMPDEVSRN